jgi:hypothetical protein
MRSPGAFDVFLGDPRREKRFKLLSAEIHFVCPLLSE